MCVSARDSSVAGGAVWAGWRWGHPGPGGGRGSHRLPCQRWAHIDTQGCSRPPPYSPAGKHSRTVIMRFHYHEKLHQGIDLLHGYLLMQHCLHLFYCTSKQAEDGINSPSDSAVHSHVHKEWMWRKEIYNSIQPERKITLKYRLPGFKGVRHVYISGICPESQLPNVYL